jgi:asparagine synthase (glutamine-hydrolysing)
MCGIAGWIGAHSIPLDADKFCEKSLRLLGHRGPDGKGSWVEKQKRAVFCHTRLAIIGTDSSCAQPMSCVGNKWQIVFNGEIYNYQELKKELIFLGYTFENRSDTEVIAASYDCWGIDAFSKLRGMFAVALWDIKDAVGYIVRDEFGIKPLYIKKHSQGLFFSSEIRLLMEISDHQNKLNTTALATYLAMGSVSEPLTIISGIETLEPGTLLKISNGNFTVVNFKKTFPNTGSEDYSADDAQNLRTGFIDSVKSHLVSDVPVGLFLSGGIDSSCIAASLSLLGKSNTGCFTISFGNHPFSEGEQARKTAKLFNLEFYCQNISAPEAQDLFIEYLDAQDQPSIDGFNTFTVSKLAASKGYKVVLSGLGADELFGGYPSFKNLPKLIMLGSKPGLIRKLFSDILKSLSHHKLKRFADILSNCANLGAVYRSYRGIFSEVEISKIMKIFDESGEFSCWKNYTDCFYDYKNTLESISELEMKKYMLNQLLRDSDVMSMANQLELRVPFLDSHFLSVVRKISPNKRFQKGKKILIEAFPELPIWVTNEKKKGFLFPMQNWLICEWKDMNSWIANKAKIDTSVWYRKVALISLERWMQKHLGVSQA